ncbi:MAG: hypothetical protein HUJ25_03880 [Crocinitomicaceae bacterium]|nr:hypothetical protein [Crocinitomicaceae bacterium]
MKLQIRSIVLIGIFFLMDASTGLAQLNKNLQYNRAPGFQGINQFETPKDDSTEFDGMQVQIGGDFALQFQSIQHSTMSGDTLIKLGSNFNLPTANLNLGVQLANGIRMSLSTYLSSRNHKETWVKGGYIQIDKLDFIKVDFISKLMNVLTIKAGMDEINYGDIHFRRSDNARAIYNPFVGNYIMDAFTTEVFGELTFQKNGILIVGGISNGNLNQSVIIENKDPKPSFYGKIGYDSNITNDLRLRLTGSAYISPGYDNGHYLYNGDRAGARYYSVLQEYNASDNFRSGRFSPGFRKFNAVQVNPFVKWKGLEFFGVFEWAQGAQGESISKGNYTQWGAEVLYRIGENEKFYLGARYNTVGGMDSTNAKIKNITRVNAGGGWFITDNVLMKAEYVYQDYSGSGWDGSVYRGANFKGVMLEAVIGF